MRNHPLFFLETTQMLILVWKQDEIKTVNLNIFRDMLSYPKVST